MHTIRRWIPSHIRYLLSVHLMLMVIFSLFRYIMLVYNKPTYFFDMERSISLRKAFQIGLWFDLTIASYAMILPYLVLTYTYIRKKEPERVFKYVRWYSAIVILVSLIICAADVPYFKYYNSRLNIATVHVKNMAQIGEFILKEVKYYPFILVFLVGIWGIGKLVRRLWNNAWKTKDTNNSLRQKWTATASAFLFLWQQANTLVVPFNGLVFI